MTAQSSSGLISRAVREALSTLVSPQLCEQVIARSLAAQGLSEIPETGAALGGWLEGALRIEVEHAVGSDAAELLVAQLGPIAAYAAVSRPRTPTPAQATTHEPARRPSEQSAGNLAAALLSAADSAAPSRTALLAPTPAPGAAPSAPAAMTSAVRTPLAPADPDDQPPRVPTLRSETPISVGVRTPVVSAPDDAGGKPSSRPTQLRFNVSRPGDSQRAAAPSRFPAPFGSEPPTASFARPAPATAMTLPAPANGSASPHADALDAVRTLPPVQPVQSTMPRAPRTQRRTQMPEREGAGRGLPLVLTATSHADSLAALRRYLSGTANVVHVPDFVGLLDALDEDAVVEPIVLIDCQRPTVHITSVAAIGEDLPRGTTVVLWGADEATWQQVDRDRMPSCRWVRCSSEATPHDVGSLCSMLLG